jgi:hypothetical protein
MRITLRLTVMAAAVFLVVSAVAEGGQSADEIARALVIGQAYVSGNVYVAGFVADERRSWPQRIEGAPLKEGRRERVTADFYRIVAQDSEEHYWFPQREADAFDDDIFMTVDRAAVEDRNLARYRAPAGVDQPVSFLGWDQRLGLADISYRSGGQPRPITAAEQQEVSARRSATPKNIECTTVPRFLDDAKVVLTANVSKTTFSIRLSKYTTPGCAGHLTDIYVLDVIAPGQDPRRFEFLHYQGVI